MINIADVRTKVMSFRTRRPALWYDSESWTRTLTDEADRVDPLKWGEKGRIELST
jgi:hypothetical protein